MIRNKSTSKPASLARPNGLSGRAGRYFLYALGEIILVVIGILIALQINNWNESQKKKQIETQYLNNIVRDLKEQLKSIDAQMKMEQSIYETASYLIEDYNNDQMFTLDSLFYSRATWLNERKTFVITDPTYTDLVSSGNISILKNEVNKNLLLNYYQELERIEKIIQNNNSLLTNQLYSEAYLKIGYNYENYHNLYYGENLSNFPGHIVIPKYETDIQEISKRIILKDENKLALMNAITFRQSVSLNHYNLLLIAKSDTKSLIEELNQ